MNQLTTLLLSSGLGLAAAGCASTQSAQVSFAGQMESGGYKITGECRDTPGGFERSPLYLRISARYAQSHGYDPESILLEECRMIREEFS